MVYIKSTLSFYSTEQLGAYLKCIGLNAPPEPTLEYLSLLALRHRCSFPWENTPMHYTPDRKMDVDPAALYERFVGRKGGSYCFGHNTVFLGMLRAVGYRYSATYF